MCQWQLHLFLLSFAGIKLTLNPDKDTDCTIAQALNVFFFNIDVDIYSNSWGPIDYGNLTEGPGLLTAQSLELGVTKVSH